MWTHLSRQSIPQTEEKFVKTFRWEHSFFFSFTTLRFRSLFTSLFAAAYSHGEAAAADAPLHKVFSAHFEFFFYGGIAAIACSPDRDMISAVNICILFSFRCFIFYFQFP